MFFHVNRKILDIFIKYIHEDDDDRRKDTKVNYTYSKQTCRVNLKFKGFIASTLVLF